MRKKTFKELDLTILTKFERETPIAMYKSCFWYKDYKVVNSIQEAIDLESEGWSWYTSETWYFMNITLFIYRALKKLSNELGKRKII